MKQQNQILISLFFCFISYFTSLTTLKMISQNPKSKESPTTRWGFLAFSLKINALILIPTRAIISYLMILKDFRFFPSMLKFTK